MATALSVYVSVLWSVVSTLAVSVGRGARRVLGALRDYALVSGSYPSLTRDPGIAAFVLIEHQRGHQRGHRRSGEVRPTRPFRGYHHARVRVADEQLLPFGVGL
jgi:hypothetical protein